MDGCRACWKILGRRLDVLGIGWLMMGCSCCLAKGVWANQTSFRAGSLQEAGSKQPLGGARGKGREEARVQPKRRARSKESSKGVVVPSDLVEAFKTRLAKLELAVGDIMDTLDSREEEQESMKQELKGAMQGALNSFIDSVNKSMKEFRGTIAAEISSLKEDVAVCKVAVSIRVITASVALKIKVPEPPKFGGKRDAKELDNFIWLVEQYLDALNVLMILTNSKLLLSTLNMMISFGGTSSCRDGEGIGGDSHLGGI
ncbi:hypothetical protein GH714_013207 [Hevea brasiliensis]|uniref:Uncharacterized protein n=1 Tax=Hevea brasiliensis TaxID=3981 RepID=A0A6A6MDE3_HEVBR|nr:hypothetical protein GH714_013207 [Hevea brasiliensis]